MSSKSSQRLRRRLRLLAEDPFCPDCGVEMVWFPTTGGTPLPDNFATIEHVNSRNRYPEGRPVPGKTVLLCNLCNENRSRAEQGKVPLQEVRVMRANAVKRREERALTLAEARRRMREAEPGF
jgi:hypothetical protein